jgi:hypothetical protein
MMSDLMGSSSLWSMESKEFEMVVVGGDTGVRFHERCRGMRRSILLDRAETVWLLNTIDELVAMEDSRVFWDLSRVGYPWIRRSNRHGVFLVVEEFNGRTRSSLVFVPEGRKGEGWARLATELRLVVKQLSSSRDKEVRDGSKVHKAERGRERRSFIEVTSLTLPQMEESFEFSTTPIARVPKWVKDSSKVAGFHVPMKNLQAQERVASGPAIKVPAKSYF